MAHSSFFPHAWLLALTLAMVPRPSPAAPQPIFGYSHQIFGFGDPVDYGPALTPSTGSNWTASPPEFLCGSVDGQGRDEMVTVEKVSDVLARVWIAQPGDSAHHLDRSVIYPASGVSRLGDVNGDGRDDLVIFYRNGFGGPEAGDVMVCLARSDALGFAAAVKWQEYFCINNETPLLADFDGDGTADIATVFNGGTGQIYGALSNGSSFAATGELWASGVAAAGNQSVTPDLNGDGLAELVICYPYPATPTHRILSLKSTPGGHALEEQESTPNDPGGAVYGNTLKLSADLNGDGRSDLVQVPQPVHPDEQFVFQGMGITHPDGKPGIETSVGYIRYPANPASTPIHFAIGRLNPDLCDDLLVVTMLPAAPPALPTASARFTCRIAGNPYNPAAPTTGFMPWIQSFSASSPHYQTTPFGVQGNFGVGTTNTVFPAGTYATEYRNVRLRWLDRSRTWREGPIIPLSSQQTSLSLALPPEAQIGYFEDLVEAVRVSVICEVGVSSVSTIFEPYTSNVIEIPSWDPYKAWAVAQGLTTLTYAPFADQDPDHDGLPNFMEYLTGLNPLTPNAAEDGNPALVTPGDHFHQSCTKQPLTVTVPTPIFLGYYPRLDFHLRYLPASARRFPWILRDSTDLENWTDSIYGSDLPWSNDATNYLVNEAGSAFMVAHVEQFATDTGIRKRSFRRMEAQVSQHLLRSGF